MKKILALLILLAAFPAFGQAVNSDQIKKATNGGLTGDAASAVWVAPSRSNTAPSSPVAGALWCDTNTTPCLMKTYNGSSWVIPLSNGSVPTQADVSSFPGSPSDGQIFFSKSPPALWVYNSTTSLWYALAYTAYQSGANYLDVYTAAAITAPGAATAATSGTAGSLSAGTYSYKITFANATGGETTGGTVSNTITSLVSKSVDLSAIPTGGTGTTQRNIYRTKVGTAGVGPWYWVGNIADNSTTTFHDGASDASQVLLTPEHNFSGALPAAWTYINTTASTTSGGCGISSARGTMICRAGQALNGSGCNAGSATSETRQGAYFDLTSYASGNYTVQYRIKQLALSGDSNLGVISPQILSLRNGTADNSPMVTYAVGGQNGTAGCSSGSTTTTLPFSSSNHTVMFSVTRATIGGARSANNVASPNPWPQVDALPMWVRWIKKGNTGNGFVSADGVNWTKLITCNSTTNTNAGCSEANVGTSATVSLEMLTAAFATLASQQVWIEFDSFTLTVN